MSEEEHDNAQEDEFNSNFFGLSQVNCSDCYSKRMQLLSVFRTYEFIKLSMVCMDCGHLSQVKLNHNHSLSNRNENKSGN